MIRARPKPSGPRYRAIYDLLLKRIQSGACKPGDRFPTEAALIEEFNVSRITVIRALRELAASGYLQRRQGSGSFVSQPEQESVLIGLIIPGVAYYADISVFSVVERHLISGCARKKWQALIGDTMVGNDPSGKQAVEMARRLVAHGVRGAIILPHAVRATWSALNFNTLAEFDRARVPVVLLDRDVVKYPARSNHDLICMDNEHAGRILGEHLITRECRRVIFVSAGENLYNFPQIKERIEGLRKGLQSGGVELPDSWIISGTVLDASFLKSLYKKLRPDAVVFENDHIAAIAMRILIRARIDIPKTLKLASFDDAPEIRSLPISLTTVAQPCKDLALRALSSLSERMENLYSRPSTIKVQGRLVIGDSTAIA